MTHYTSGSPQRIAGLSLPAGTRRNKIERRLFSFISQNWHGKPAISHEQIKRSFTFTTIAFGRLELQPAPQKLVQSVPEKT
jgi:hypothetical protein